MPGVMRPSVLAPTGSTGNNTHTGGAVAPNVLRFCVLFVVEAVGATPTVTYKVQGALDDPTVTDANAGWFDLMLLVGSSDAGSATPAAVTAVGSVPNYLSLAQIRFVRRVRVVTSANTNVTYRAELHAIF